MTSADVGKETERMAANWLRENGWPGAERRIKTGYRTAIREVADEGDILGCIGLCFQVKSLRPATRMELAIPSWLMETEAQRVASKSSLGFLVVRRWGTTDVGRWWAFQSFGQLVRLTTTDVAISRLPGAAVPVRMDMAALAGILHQTGWSGTDAEEEVS